MNQEVFNLYMEQGIDAHIEPLTFRSELRLGSSTMNRQVYLWNLHSSIHFCIHEAFTASIFARHELSCKVCFIRSLPYSSLLSLPDMIDS